MESTCDGATSEPDQSIDVGVNQIQDLEQGGQASGDISQDSISIQSQSERKRRRFRPKLKNFMRLSFSPSHGSGQIDSGASKASSDVPMAITETTPLVQSTIQLDTTTLPPASDSPARHRWAKIRAFVTSGELLLQQATCYDDIDGQSDVESRRVAVQAVIRNHLDFNLGHCMAAFAFFVGLSVLVFSYLADDWPVVDAVYFSIVSLSTVGYGDVVPKSPLEKWFTCIFALAGVATLGIAIGVLGNSVIEAQESAYKLALGMSQQRVLHLFSSSNDPESEMPPQSNGISSGFTRPLKELCLVTVVLAAFYLAVSHDPSINGIGDSIYFLIITSTTCGYGDVAPTSPTGRALTSLFIPFAVGAMGRWLSIIAGTIISAKQSKFHKSLTTRELTLDDLDVMDVNGDGNVTRAEFLEFMLVAMNQVDHKLLDELRSTFTRLDKDGSGILSKADLIAMARKKLKEPSRKLNLAKYKSHLQHQAGVATTKVDGFDLPTGNSTPSQPDLGLFSAS